MWNPDIRIWYKLWKYVKKPYSQWKYVKIVHNLESNQRPREFGLNNENM
jgi:hypothetical protein